jgi:hypothetical protein
VAADLDDRAANSSLVVTLASPQRVATHSSDRGTGGYMLKMDERRAPSAQAITAGDGWNKTTSSEKNQHPSEPQRRHTMMSRLSVTKFVVMNIAIYQNINSLPYIRLPYTASNILYPSPLVWV